jgi:hypothetical protein
MKKLIPLLILLPILASAGGWYYHTTTDTYAFNQIKTACKNNDIEAVASTGLGHINGETREFTDSEITIMKEGFKKVSSDCPYAGVFTKKITKAKLSPDELKRLNVAEGYKYSFEGEPDTKSLKMVKLQGRWRLLLVDASANVDRTVQPSQAPAGSPAPASSGQYQTEINSQPPAGPEAMPSPPVR